jgi:hypothetical protein
LKPRNVANGLEEPDWSYWCMSLVERPNVRRDEFGRATHFYQAVIDSRKDLDKGAPHSPGPFGKRSEPLRLGSCSLDALKK